MPKIQVNVLKFWLPRDFWQYWSHITHHMLFPTREFWRQIVPSDLFPEQFQVPSTELDQQEHSNWQDLQHGTLSLDMMHGSFTATMIFKFHINAKVTNTHNIYQLVQLNTPKDIASLPLTLRPVNIISFATDFPTNLGSRCVPPALSEARITWESDLSLQLLLKQRSIHTEI